jgi:(2Fe-2S) ferredoxin
MLPEPAKQVLVCQNRSCRKAGSAKILATFIDLVPQDVAVVACGCLGHCGSGPMVLILPAKTWYDHLHPQTVAAIVYEAF